MIEKGGWVDHDEFTNLNLTIVTRDRHLRALSELKLIENIHQNGAIYYRINKSVFDKMVSGFNHLFDLYQS